MLNLVGMDTIKYRRFKKEKPLKLAGITSEEVEATLAQVARGVCGHEGSQV